MSLSSELSQRQRTLAGSTVFAGIGVHSGRHVRVVLKPAAVNHGIVFVRSDITDRDNRIPALADLVGSTQLNTEIKNAAGVAVSTIEHLMAALAALGVDNAVVELDGAETPIMDGSAQPFVDILDRVGVREQDAPRRSIEIIERIEVRHGDKWAALTPSPRFEVAFELQYDCKAIGTQRVDLEVTEESFRDELAAARTFGFIHEVEHLKSLGLAKGASLENAVGLDGDTILNPEGLRMEREFVRHKALDAVGDLYTLGAPIIGRFESVKGGHALNNALCRALLAQPQAWRWRPPLLAQDLAQAG
jgi:UDP-3-O-[3-hydroxymyristoyl] N-acetylglucosamine deacetylase